MNKIYKIGIIGLGQIGNYLYRELNLKKKYIETKTSKKIQIIGISAKNKNKRRKYKIDKNILSKIFGIFLIIVSVRSFFEFLSIS